MAEPAQIYQFVVSHGRPYQLPGTWARFECTPEFTCLPEDRPKLLNDLRSTFSDDELCASRVIVRVSDNEFAYNPLFGAAESVICAVKDKIDGEPLDLWAGGESVGGRHWPLDLLYREYRFCPSWRGCRRVASTSRFPWRTWRSCGRWDIRLLLRHSWIISCVETSIDSWSGSGRDALSAVRTDRFHHGMRRLSANLKVLVLVGCSLACFDVQEPPQVPTIRQHFIELDKYLDVWFEHVEIWCPPHDDMHRLRFSLEKGSASDVAMALRESASENCRDLTLPPFVPVPNRALWLKP